MALPSSASLGGSYRREWLSATDWLTLVMKASKSSLKSLAISSWCGRLLALETLGEAEEEEFWDGDGGADVAVAVAVDPFSNSLSSE